MLFYSDEKLKKELANIAKENNSLESISQIYTGLRGEDLNGTERSQSRNTCISLYEKKRDLTDRISSLLRAIDERWLSSLSGYEDTEITNLYNKAIELADKINYEADQLRQLINDLI